MQSTDIKRHPLEPLDSNNSSEHICPTSNIPLWPSNRIQEILLIFLAAFDSLTIPEIKQQEALGPRLAHLSDLATADMQMLCNLFPILSLQLMKESSF